MPADLRRSLRAHGFAETGLVTRWADIVGPAWAQDTMPLKLAFPVGDRRGGTLTIAIDGPLATQFKHLEPLVLERIAAHFGYRAVERIRLVHQDLSDLRTAATRPAAPQAPLPTEDAQEVGSISHPGLRAALTALGQTVSGQTVSAMTGAGRSLVDKPKN